MERVVMERARKAGGQKAPSTLYPSLDSTWPRSQWRNEQRREHEQKNGK
jgi:hypothetical protein